MQVSFVTVFLTLGSIFQSSEFTDLLLKACFFNLVRRYTVENFPCTHIRVLQEIFDKNMLVESMKIFFWPVTDMIYR